MTYPLTNDNQTHEQATPEALAAILTEEEFEVINGYWQRIFPDTRGYAEVYVSERGGKRWVLIDSEECLPKTMQDAVDCAERIEAALAQDLEAGQEGA